MGSKFFSTTHPGVFYRILKQKDPATGKPDCSFYISKPDDFGVAHWITVGRKSEGMTARKTELQTVQIAAFQKNSRPRAL